MVFFPYLFRSVVTLPTATILVPLLIALAFFHKPLLKGAASILRRTVHAVKHICLSLYHTSVAFAIYAWLAGKLLLAVTFAPLQLYPFYNLYVTAYHVCSLVIIPSLQQRVSLTRTWQFLRNTLYAIASPITRLGHFITSPFQLVYQYIRGQRHIHLTQPNQQSNVSHTTTEQSQTNPPALRLENEGNSHAASRPSRIEECQTNTMTQSNPTEPAQASLPKNRTRQPTASIPTSDKPSQATIPSSLHASQRQSSTSWFTRCISTSIQAISYTAGLIAATFKKLALTIGFCLRLLLIQCPHYLGKAVLSLAKTFVWHTVFIPYKLLKLTMAAMRSLGSMLTTLFCQSLPYFVRSSMNYFSSYQFFQHALLAATIFQARAINLSIHALYASFGFSSYIITSAIILSCPFLMIGLYKLNLNLVTTIRQKVFHAPPLPYPDLLNALAGHVFVSTITYFTTVIGSILMTLIRLHRTLPDPLYQTRQNNPSQPPSLQDFIEDTVPLSIRSSWADILRSNLSVAHGNQPPWETHPFFQGLSNNLALQSTRVAPTALLDQIKGKDETWPCTDDIISNLDESTKAILQNTSSLTCPITHDLIRQPIICSDGNTYEKKYLLNWLEKQKNISPLTREPIVSLSPNRLYIQTLQQAINLHQAGQPQHTPTSIHTKQTSQPK